MDEPEYKVGDRVQQVTEHWLNDSAWGTSDTRFTESPHGIGSTAKITHVYTDRLHVEWEGTDKASVIARKSVLPYSVAVIAAEEEQQAINSVMASLLGTHDKHPPVRMFAIVTESGHLVESPDWFSPADVMSGAHDGMGRRRETSTLVYRDDPMSEWKPWKWDGPNDPDPAPPQDDDLTAVTIITGTITHGEERCYECGGELPQGSDVVATIGMSRETDNETVRPRCTSCHIDQD